MARQTNGTTSYLDAGVLSMLTGAATVSLSAWISRPSTGVITALGAAGDSAVSRFGIWHYSDNNIYVVADTLGDVDYGFVASTATGWHHHCVVYDGTASGNANRLKFWLDGAAQTLSFGVETIPATIPGTPVWRLGYFNGFAVGQYAETGLWNVVLNANEITALALGVSPRTIRNDGTTSSALRHYWKLEGILSPEPDWAPSRSAPATLVSAPTAATHAPVHLPARPWASMPTFVTPASAALTGTMTAGITEADVVAGSKVLTVTVTNDTFIPV